MQVNLCPNHENGRQSHTLFSRILATACPAIFVAAVRKILEDRVTGQY